MDERDPARLAVGAIFHGRYQIVRRIKAGGMGAVYEVIHLETRRRRALKVMLPSVISDPELRDRFKQEATIAADITSDHIVETFDAGVDSETGTPFLVMELLQGEDLGQPLKERGRFSPEEVVPLLAQAALALDKTHAAGIVHRDLKPENLFITRRDDGSIRLKVLDFGIAKLVAQGSKSNDTTRALGSPVYMSPEQLRGRGDIGPPSDLYALAHVAYKLLTGTSYWEPERRDADNIFSLITSINEGAGEAASVRAARVGVELPPAFDAWFTKATAVRPENRYQHASTLAAELARALDVPIQSAPLDTLGARLPASTGAAGSAGSAATAAPFAGSAALSTATPATLPSTLALSSVDAEVNTRGVTPSGVSVEPSRRPTNTPLRLAITALGIAAGLALAGPPVVSYLRGGPIEASAQSAAIAPQEADVTPSNRAALEPDAEPATILTASAEPMAASADKPGAPPGAPPSRSEGAALEPGARPPAIHPAAAERTAAARPGAPAEPLPRDADAGSARSYGPIDRAAANQAVQHKAKIASTLCRGRSGPKVITATLIFNRTGSVVRIDADMQARVTAGGGCVIGVLHGTMIRPFDGEPEPFATAVALQ